MNLSDFINGAGSLYGAYTAPKIAEANALTAQAQAQAAQANASAMSSRTKTIILYSVGGILALVLVVFLIKKLK